MVPDSEIGRVTAVDTAQVSIKLNHDLKGMTRNTYEGTQEVGGINSYVIIPVGARRLVAMVTHVELKEETEIKTNRAMVMLPVIHRLMKATLIGTIDNNPSQGHSRDRFRQGISIFPVLDNPVHLAGRADLDAIFGPIQLEEHAQKQGDAQEYKYRIPIGESSIIQGRPIRIDPDAFFGKHAAILGSTGSGKSCTIATLLQSIHTQKEVRRTTCVIFDISGEYRAAFPEQSDGSWEGKALHIPADLANTKERLMVPYWFMNSEEFMRLFHASGDTQRPVLLEALQQAREKESGTACSADTPTYFDKETFCSDHLKGERKLKIINYMETMLLRINRLLTDRRFEFLFGSVGKSVPNPTYALAAFLRDILGIGASSDVTLSNKTQVGMEELPFYDRQRGRDKKKVFDIVILDLNFLPAEVLEYVTALIGRLILDFLQRLRENNSENAQDLLPVVLVLEEAQNYIQQSRPTEEDSVARLTFERIAREGRKYGLSLVVTSQRPSELSKTVLSQCNSFIVHRLQNPEDLGYFRKIVPNIYGPMLEQLPALDPQTALVLGECISAPALVKIREAQPVPKSRDPRFYESWINPDPPKINVEDICDSWK